MKIRHLRQRGRFSILLFLLLRALVRGSHPIWQIELHRSSPLRRSNRRRANLLWTPMRSNHAMQTSRVYELHPRRDHPGVDLIPRCCHSVACGTASRTQSQTAVEGTKMGKFKGESTAKAVQRSEPRVKIQLRRGVSSRCIHRLG